MTTPQALRESARAALAKAREAVDTFKALPPEATSDDVALGFDRIRAPLNGVSSRVVLMREVHPDPAVRDAARELELEFQEFETDLSLDRDAYARLAAASPERVSDPRSRRALEHTLRDYRRAGVDRDETTRERVRALAEELVRVGQEFDGNVVTCGRDYVVKDGHAGLAGLPKDFLASHPEREDGTVLLSTDPQDRLPVMTYAEREDVRRGYHVASGNRAYPQNVEPLKRMLARRHELATLLGYPSWADYATEVLMIGSAASARAFIERIAALARDRAAAERAELLEEKRRIDPSASEVGEWDRGFLVERVKQRRYGFESQSVRPYFAYENVRDGVLATSAALYDVAFRRDEGAQRWHDDVEVWEIVDGGEVVARFWLDMHPRDGKFKHAAVFDLTSGLAGERLPEAALVCNFPRPSASDPALLEHEQVTTFFHEFGHLLHHLFAGEHHFLRFSGITCEWDFVEAPSQLYEEWAWDAGVLARFATHVETGLPIPAELVARMRAADEYGKALHVAQQMFYAMLSLSYHDRDPAGLDPTEHMLRIKQEYAPLAHAEGTYLHAAFGHLNGYSAIYYTYMWSLVIAKDLLGGFGEDLMDTQTARRYRDAVLAPGGTRDANELVRAFLGREHAFDAFASWLAK